MFSKDRKYDVALIFFQDTVRNRLNQRYILNLFDNANQKCHGYFEKPFLHIYDEIRLSTLKCCLIIS